MRNLRGAHHRRDRRVAVSVVDRGRRIEGRELYFFHAIFSGWKIFERERERVDTLRIYKIEIAFASILAINPFRRRGRRRDYIQLSSARFIKGGEEVK